MTLWQKLRHPITAIRRAFASRMIQRGYCPECYDDDPYCRVCRAGEFSGPGLDPVERVTLWERWLNANPECRIGEPHNGTI